MPLEINPRSGLDPFYYLCWVNGKEVRIDDQILEVLLEHYCPETVPDAVAELSHDLWSHSDFGGSAWTFQLPQRILVVREALHKDASGFVENIVQRNNCSLQDALERVMYAVQHLDLFREAVSGSLISCWQSTDGISDMPDDIRRAWYGLTPEVLGAVAAVPHIQMEKQRGEEELRRLTRACHRAEASFNKWLKQLRRTGAVAGELR